MLCIYGCGQEARFQFKNGNYCCSKDWESCPVKRTKNSKLRKVDWENLEKRKKIVDAQTKSWKSLERIDKQRQRFSGENSLTWNPNREEVFAPYTELFSNVWYREQIKKEQGYKDPITNKNLTVRACLHHIDYNKQNDLRENLIWLNVRTHAKTNYNKEYWKRLF